MSFIQLPSLVAFCTADCTAVLWRELLRCVLAVEAACRRSLCGSQPLSVSRCVIVWWIQGWPPTSENWKSHGIQRGWGKCEEYSGKFGERCKSSFFHMGPLSGADWHFSSPKRDSSLHSVHHESILFTLQGKMQVGDNWVDSLAVSLSGEVDILGQPRKLSLA